MVGIGTFRSFPISLILLPVIAVSLLCLNTVPARADESPSGAVDTPATLHLTSGGHILCFDNGYLMIASADHMLKTEFTDANAVPPQSESPASASTAEIASAGAADGSRVVYRGLWQGVDLVYTFNPGSIVESSYYIGSAAIAESVDRIRLRYNRPVSLDSSGALVTAFDSGSLTESRPVAWQEIDGQKRMAVASFRLYSGNEIGFSVTDYLPGIPLVIDPDITWSTFLGNTLADQATAIALDGSGNIYVTGYSFSSWQGSAPPVRTYTASRDAFAAKLDSSGSVIWNTFLGGTSVEAGYGITLDSGGNVYVVGGASSSWDSPVRFISTNGDAFAAKLDNNGGHIWHTFLGGTSWDNAKGVAADSSGNVYVVGDSNGTWQGGSAPVRGYTSDKDAWVAKLASDGSLTANTFLGAGGLDDGMAIALDGTNIYIAGYSTATWQGTSLPVRAYTGSYDSYVTKLDFNLDLIWNTFQGGTDEDASYGIAFYSGNVYVAGHSFTTWQGTSPPVRSFTSGRDIFVAALNSTTGALIWNTFLGGSGTDEGCAIGVDSGGNIYVTGYSTLTWQGTSPPVRSFSSGTDGYAARLANDGSLVWNTFLGGSGVDYGWGIAADSTSVYVAGKSDAAWQGASLPVLAYSALDDGFVVKLDNLEPTSSSVHVGGTFSPVNRWILVVPLLILVFLIISSGSFPVFRRRRGI
jgi:hypothetical protein